MIWSVVVCIIIIIAVLIYMITTMSQFRDTITDGHKTSDEVRDLWDPMYTEMLVCFVALILGFAYIVYSIRGLRTVLVCFIAAVVLLPISLCILAALAIFVNLNRLINDLIRDGNVMVVS